MTDDDDPPAASEAPHGLTALLRPPAPPASASRPPPRSRPKPGERREQILQTLAAMLEAPGSDRITTAALASRLALSEAALYRHFASKAQMFEALIDFIEGSIFRLINQVLEREIDGREQAARIALLVLQFGERNPGMARVMVGDALVHEHERLAGRMVQFFDRLEMQWRQCLRVRGGLDPSPTPTADAQAIASALGAEVIGRLHRHVRSGFRRSPTEHVEPVLRRLLQP